ncbi:MAG: AAA family ATPase, partial [Propionibacteriaceae bacterium]|nr:AAA family ATPase [Propionibacteriaceae bacterium]
LDMAVSVASATDCLGRFPVDCPGRTLIYMAEDNLATVRARIRTICNHRNIDISSLNLHVITAAYMRLDLKDDQLRLVNTIATYQPKMLLLDPLVRLHRLDESSASDISGLLGYLRELQRGFDLAIVLVHHAGKKHHAHPGQALRGSSDLHAFGDSNLYLDRNNDRIKLTIEHRSARPPEPLTLQLVSDPDGASTHLEVASEQTNSTKNNPDPTNLEKAILATLSSSTGAK